MRTLGAALLALSLLACGGGGATDDDDDPTGDGGTDPTGDGGPDDDDPTGDGGTDPGPCTLGERRCDGAATEEVCQDVGGTPTWVEAACGDHTYCIDDRCVAACLDECALGDTQGGATCALWDDDAGAFVAPGGGGHDLARRHLAWIRDHHLANGYIANTLFTSSTHQTKLAYTGTVDAAEWTGMYLAAESLRALTTHSPDAEASVEAQIERMYQLFDITGTPGYMARFWAPRGGDPLLAALYDADDWSHFAVDYDGGPAFYHAWTSRDMYAGVAMSLGLAYDATTSSAHRAMVREVAVTLARELIRDRQDVPVRVRYNLFGSWQTADLTYDLRHTILIPEEMVDGRVFIQIGTDAEPDDYGSSELRGAREFVPDFQTVLGQTPGLGPLIPSIPRPTSAMMLANFLELALHVTEGVPGTEADRAAIRAHYDAERAGWLALMRQYAYHNEESCWSQYFGITLAHHPIYGVLRLTDDAAWAQSLRQDVLAAQMRPWVENHHNPYFDYIAAAVGPAGLIPAAELAETTSQLPGFVAPPKASVAVNHTGAYPANGSCPGLASVAVDIEDRVPMDFLWQHHPFRLVNQFVDARHVYPGADYLVAYWLGRHHGFIQDDAPSTCTRWRD